MRRWRPGAAGLTAAIKGIGGCPMAGNALVGNMDTEWMIEHFRKKGLVPALDGEALRECSRLAGEIFNLMEFQLPISMASLPRPIRYGDKILLVGSCFTEHIGGALADWKFDTLQNPNGILFDPASVASSLASYCEPEHYGPGDLFFAGICGKAGRHHGIFSGTDREEVLRGINASQERAHGFLKEADWLIITLGSSFSYRLKEGAQTSAGAGFPGMPVANCHRAPQQDFRKHLMSIEETVNTLDGCLQRLFHIRHNLQVLVTVSPVRHIRDGVVENNRSKARLIESVHQLVNTFERVWYFPAYELVIDVLRDYRFYDIDLVHPNYPATQFVLEKFTQYCIDESSQSLLEEVKQLVVARRHRPRHPSTAAHGRFMREHFAKADRTCPAISLAPSPGRDELFSRGAGCQMTQAAAILQFYGALQPGFRWRKASRS